MDNNHPIKPNESFYEPADFVMVRTPLFPFDSLRPLLDLPLKSPAASSIVGTDSTVLSEAIQQDMLAVRAWLENRLTDPAIQEALQVASPNLFQAIPRWRQAPDNKKGRQAQANLLRYLIRMASRPTPFGLFAGVAPAYIGSQMDLKIGQLEQNRKRIRPDLQWLLHEIRSLEQRAEVLNHLQFFTNPATFVSGGRLYIPHLDAYGQAEKEKTVSLRATSVVMQALALARNGVTLDSLKRQLLNERPTATENQAQGLLDGLRQQGALLSDLRPPLTGADAFHYVLQRIETIPGCADIREQLQAVMRLVETYNAQPVGEDLVALQALHQATEIPNSKIHSTLEVDMATALEAREFSAEVASELARAVEVMFRVSSYGPSSLHLAAYRREFLERYGEAREMPLLELMDGDIGLGSPPTYLHPPRVGESPVLTPLRYPARDRALLELASTALYNRQREIELTQTILSQIQVNPTWQDAAVNTLEVYAFVAASSQQAINKGNYHILVGPIGVAPPAGRSFGRFSDILGDDITHSITQLAREEESLRPGRIFAELVYLPADGHFANVAVRPAVREYEIVVHASPGVERTHTIPLDDLVVGVRGDRFYLRSVSRQAEVIVCNTHVLNPMLAPNECRFLTEIADEGNIFLGMFDWGAAAQLPFLPRLRAGRTILCPARWQMPAELVGTGKSRPDPAWWYQQFQTWRQTWNVPRYVYWTEFDNRLLMDLENPACVIDLGDECRERAASKGTLILEELLPGFEDVWTEGPTGRHIVEFIIPFKRRRPAVQPASPLTTYRSVSLGERQRLPGSDWLYAKLYSGRTRHDDLIAGPIRDLTNQVMQDGLANQWFFIRYTDPHPHIRLRFKGEPEQLLSRLLPVLTAWGQSLVENGLLQKLALDSYDREVERYGGPEGLQLAEQIFAADSAAVADIVALRIQRVLSIPLTDLAIHTVDHLSSSLGLTATERLNLYQAVRQGQEAAYGSQIGRLAKTFFDYRKTAQRMIGDRDWLQAQSGGSELEECLRHQSAVLGPLGKRLCELVEHDQLWTSKVSFLASCMHMHCNRLIGLNRPLEFEVNYYLERTLASLEKYSPEDIHV